MGESRCQCQKSEKVTGYQNFEASQRKLLNNVMDIKGFKLQQCLIHLQERTEGNIPFDVVGIDFTGPIHYNRGTGNHKAYIILYTCSLTRGLHLEVLPDMVTQEFLASFKRFIAARGRPLKIISVSKPNARQASRLP